MSQLINADKIIAQINKPTIVLNKFKAANIEFNYIYFKIKKRPRYCEAFLKMKKNSLFFYLIEGYHLSPTEYVIPPSSIPRSSSTLSNSNSSNPT